MGTCLTTTLHEAVTDSNLLKLGEIKFKMYNTTNNPTRFVGGNVSSELHIEVKAPGYITNETGTQNLGTTASFPANTFVSCYLIPGRYDVIVSSKYNLTMIVASGDSYLGGSSSRNLGFDLKDLTGCENSLTQIRIGCEHLDGTIDDLKNHTKLAELTILSLANKKIGGKLESISGLTDLVLLHLPFSAVIGNLSSLSGMTHLTDIILTDCDIEGNVSSIASLPLIAIRTTSAGIQGTTAVLGTITTLQELLIANSQVTGSLSSLASLTSLNVLNIGNTSVVGDTSDLASLTNLTTFTYTNTAITGTWPLT